jgi:VanZ family protein
MRRLNAIVLAIYWSALLVGTHWPQMPAFGPPNTDKVLHVTAYCGLSILLSLYIMGGRKATWRQLGLVVLILALAGGLDELTQPPFQRTADWHDWFADLAGITLGAMLAAWLGLPLYRRLANRGGARDTE